MSATTVIAQGSLPGASDFEKQVAQFTLELESTVRKIVKPIAEKVDGLVTTVQKLSDADADTIRKATLNADDLAKMQDEQLDDAEQDRRLMRALIQHNAQPGAQPKFAPDRRAAELFGLAFMANQRVDPDIRVLATAKLRERFGDDVAKNIATVTPSTGPLGGFLLKEEQVSGIIARFPNHGVCERVVKATPTSAEAGSEVIDTAEWDVYHPDLGSAPTEQNPTLARKEFRLRPWCTYHRVDSWMLTMDAIVGVGDYFMAKVARAHMRGLDRRFLIGDGSTTYGRIIGAFIRASGDTGRVRVTADTGDDTFAEVIAASTKYLAKLIGEVAASGFALDFDPSWIMHHSIYFSYMGQRDTTGQPLTNFLISGEDSRRFLLGGYPVNLSTVAPALSATAVSTVMAIFGAWSEAWRLRRHTRGMLIVSSDQYKFAERQVCTISELNQDLYEVLPSAWGQLATAAS